MRIYPDTNVWNLLCDSNVDPPSLQRKLISVGSELVLGTHSVYELAKTFMRSGEAAKARGKRLFCYLKEFIDGGIGCVKQNNELMAAEMWALKLRASQVNFVLGAEDVAKLRVEVNKLSLGEFDVAVREFIEKQTAFAVNTRQQQVEFLDRHPNMRQQMKAVSEGALDLWLNVESVSSQGVGLLANHIVKYFPEAPAHEAVEYADVMLRTRFCRFAHGVVRADLYYNWRCSNRGSNPKDLVDDMYHVLNSTYCDLYLTRERGHVDYAHLLLTPATNVAIYDGTVPIESWLVARVCAASSGEATTAV